MQFSLFLLRGGVVVWWMPCVSNHPEAGGGAKDTGADERTQGRQGGRCTPVNWPHMLCSAWVQDVVEQASMNPQIYLGWRH